MIRYCRELGLKPLLTTNGVALASRIDSLFDAGLRDISIGFYGRGASFDEYTQRPGRARKIEEGVAACTKQVRRSGSNAN